MNKHYYFAGGMYYKNYNRNISNNEIVFGAVRPGGGLPYITTNINGLSLTSHHSSLYELSEDLTTAYLISPRSGGVSQSPTKVKLSLELQKEFKQVIESKDFYD